LKDERLRTYRVGRCGVDILHNCADAVVAPGVSTTLSAASHIGEGFALVAGIDHGLTSVNGFSSIAVTGEAVRLVAWSWTNVDGGVGELLH
jgi:hypothetical protein